MNYREIRESLGLSLREMGLHLGLTGDNAAHVVWEIENGRREPTGPISRLYLLLKNNPNVLKVIDDNISRKESSHGTPRKISSTKEDRSRSTEKTQRA